MKLRNSRKRKNSITSEEGGSPSKRKIKLILIKLRIKSSSIFSVFSLSSTLKQFLSFKATLKQLLPLKTTLKQASLLKAALIKKASSKKPAPQKKRSPNINYFSPLIISNDSDEEDDSDEKNDSDEENDDEKTDNDEEDDIDEKRPMNTIEREKEWLSKRVSDEENWERDVDIDMNVDDSDDDVFTESSDDHVIAFLKASFKASLKASFKALFKASFKEFMTFAYLLNVKILYESHVVFETSLSHHVNFSVEKRFFLRSYISEMTTKAKNHVNGKMLACHLVHLKAVVLWNAIKSHERNSFMLKESWQSIEQVLIYRHEAGKKSLAVDLTYQFGRARDEKISSDDSMAVATTIASKKLTTATTKLLKENDERAALASQITERMHALEAMHACESRTCGNFGRY
jgi:hypothetical protein